MQLNIWIAVYLGILCVVMLLLMVLLIVLLVRLVKQKHEQKDADSTIPIQGDVIYIAGKAYRLVPAESMTEQPLATNVPEAGSEGDGSAPEGGQDETI